MLVEPADVGERLRETLCEHSGSARLHHESAARPVRRGLSVESTGCFHGDSRLRGHGAGPGPGGYHGSVVLRIERSRAEGRGPGDGRNGCVDRRGIGVGQHVNRNIAPRGYRHAGVGPLHHDVAPAGRRDDHPEAPEIRGNAPAAGVTDLLEADGRLRGKLDPRGTGKKLQLDARILLELHEGPAEDREPGNPLEIRVVGADIAFAKDREPPAFGGADHTDGDATVLLPRQGGRHEEKHEKRCKEPVHVLSSVAQFRRGLNIAQRCSLRV